MNHSSLSPHGPDAAHIAGLFWLMFALGGVIYMVVMTIFVVAMFKGRGAAAEPAADGAPRARSDHAFILIGGVALPTIVLLVLAFATVKVTNSVTSSRRNPVRIELTASQYWWQARYLDQTQAVTANELHVPVGRPVEVGLRSTDVIHSFWVPGLAGKLDVVPGHRNVLHFEADKAGTYRGQCAEFCGLQHAHMAFLVIAEAPRAFNDWLLHQAAPATPGSVTGQAVFERQSCAGCHTIRGTTANGTVGPDLTHVAQRSTLASVAFRNTPDNLRRWITEAQSMKQGAVMPDVPMSPADVGALVDYLESLD
jgi:cytochrome c oxidase subunit 2